MSKLPPERKKKVNNYLKYSGLGFQMAAIFLIGIFGGQKIDSYFDFELPIVTILLLLVLFTGYMYKLYIDLTRD